jgi:hypothetical protein
MLAEMNPMVLPLQIRSRKVLCRVIDMLGDGDEMEMRKSPTLCAVAAFAALAVLTGPPWLIQGRAAGTITVPSAHPRLWWNAARITAAQQWYASHPFTPSSSDYLGMAAKYVITGNASVCQPAVDWAASFTISSSELSGVASDNARWSGENAIVVFDWCNSLFTDSQKSAMISRWNGYVSTLNAKSWGGPGMEANNYYWGYWRNSFEWGVASYTENPSAAGFLDYALTTRWQNGIVPYYNTKGAGGVLIEGSQYGAYVGGYTAIPLQSAVLMGRDLPNETNFYREAIPALIYATTPQPTPTKSSTSPYYQVLAANDDEKQQDATRVEYGNFMSVLAQRFSGTTLGQYARQWLNTFSPTRDYYVQAADSGGTALPLSNLPLDYYASGSGYLFARNKWGSGSTYLQVQGGWYSRTGHVHGDQGNFHLWRNGYWLTKETTGYADTITGWAGASTNTEAADAHNTLFYNGGGPPINYSKANPIIVRLESQANYTYMADDLTGAMRSTDSRFDNPTAGTTIREYLFIRPLETLVLFDRMQSTSATVKAGIAIHFENNPSINGKKIVGTNGTQALEVSSVLPASPTIRVTNEGSGIGRYRLELETSGQTQNYFMTVLQARDGSGSSLTVNSSEDASSVTLTLQHPTLGSAKVVFQKTATSTGGQFAYSSSQTIPSTLSPLASSVQAVTVNDSGIFWGTVGRAPAAPNNLRIIK